MATNSSYVRIGVGDESANSALGDPTGNKDEWIFDELPKANIVNVYRSENIAHFQLVYSIEVKYKQFKWSLQRKATQLFLLHFALKKRALLEDLQEKQEQVKDWVNSLGLGDNSTVGFQQHEDDGQGELSPTVRRDVPSIAALPVMRPTLGRLPTICERAMSAMQNYLNHFLKTLDIVNTREVCKFLEVSKLSFALEYGPKKLREGYVMVKHLSKIHPEAVVGCSCFSCCRSKNWQKVWAVLKPGFLAFLEDPFIAKPLDIIIFDVLADGSAEGHISLAKLSKERNPLAFGFVVTCGNRTVKVRTKHAGAARDWVAAINDAGLRPPEGWCHPHRFGSFAPPRGIVPDSSEAQWFVDGKAAFEAIASAIEDAKSQIFIAGWWLCPELYMRRPFAMFESSRLDSLLEAKAKEGVQVYVLLYKEVALALKINSLYSKRRLLAIHENIRVLRFPDHFASGVYLWSHHEKLVIVDQHVSFLGGLDLCFGRYDTPQHVLHDYPPTIWPGKDYYNPRESEPGSWEDAMKDELDRQRLPRMPWHDAHIALWGPACRDVARHFVQRWNHAKRQKAPNEQAIPLLLPHHHMIIPHYLSENETTDAMNEEVEDSLQQSPFLGSARSSVQDLPFLLPAEDTPEGDHQKSVNASKARQRESISKALKFGTSLYEQRLVRRRENASSFWAVNGLEGKSHLDLQMQEFVDNGDNQELRRNLQLSEKQVSLPIQTDGSFKSREWWDVDAQDRQVPNTEWGDVGPRVQCCCQVVRSVGQWSAGTSQLEEKSIHDAYCSLIGKAEHLIYIENQFFISGLDGDDIIRNRVLEALYIRIIRAYKEKQCFRVIVVLPLLPGFQGGVDDAGGASVRAIMHWQYRTICRGRFSLLQRLTEELGVEAVENYVSFYGLRNYGMLSENGPLMTSQIYVHSKLMIIDDRTVMIGSANINDRSLLGSRDSEIAVILEDTEYLESVMNCKTWKAGRFAHSLRKSLWVEHLGLHYSEADVVKDPICETTYKDVWMSRAQVNTGIYDAVFECIPNDYILSRGALRQMVAKQKDNEEYSTTDLGMAPLIITESYRNGEIKTNNGSPDCLNAIQGHLVCFPLQFLSAEDLRPVFKESEYYASAQVYH
ncbi:hypothetical protein O6H91_16G053700 [Diphasiastrum complanatum]|uniref:Uncharacterized protein n=4 Tax=Diphasiastrum complanatum TaxID=34168 RepID=A0ACC2BCD4_DIPCM|nr:hypothetical protein O6H91_16G053700 [Diphasiastrum complanatum]KAJ7527419.1 hypothetical protein O6H91_16G053700 [Diphasiastrum complanatum]